MAKEYVTRESLGLALIKHRQDLLDAKIKFVEDQGNKEGHQLAKLADTHHHISSTDRDSNFYFLRWPTELDVRKSRKDHVCGRVACKKVIKKGDFYFRRSFGQLWTIKACSMVCFCWSLP